MASDSAVPAIDVRVALIDGVHEVSRRATAAVRFDS